MKTAFSATMAVLLLMLVILVPAIAQEGPDEYEPNDSRRDATEIGGYEIEGEIGRRGDEDDWFVLEGQEGYYATFTIWYDEDECDIDFEVYSGHEVVATASSTDSPDSVSCEVTDECFIHVYIFEGRGDYTIEIEPVDTSECEGPDEREPNGDRDLADLIEGYLIEGYACEGDEDWFVLDRQEGYYPYITLYYDDDECDVDMEVFSDYDSVGSLTETSSPDGDEFDVEGTCYLRVYSFSGDGWYEIEIEPEDDDHRPSRPDRDDCEGPDEIEPNDDYEDADIIGGLDIEGYLCEGDVDWYLLEGQEGTRPYITLYYDDDEVDVDLEVWSDDDIVGTLVSALSPDGDDFRVPGECWLKVWAYEGEGWYEIEIEP